ncbi:MAG: peptidoglycan DD-metalloendopeptidase family protein [Alphaproteobacteria bacterium]|nr:MAG: peptidoglycan DD-metalloendopeptidase family protein [Alphaproteobacteria bacterium]
MGRAAQARIICLGLALLLGPTGGLTASAQPAPHAANPPPAERMSQVERDLENSRRTLETVSKQQEDAEKELSGLRERLVEAARHERTQQERVSAIEDSLATLNQREQVSRSALAARERDMATLIQAMLRLARSPPLSHLLQPDGRMLDRIRTVHLLQSPMPLLHARQLALMQDLRSLARLRRQLDRKRSEAEGARAELKSRREDIEGLIRQRDTLLGRTHEVRAAQESLTAQLTKEAQDLRQLMEKVSAHGLAPRLKPDNDSASLRSGLILPVASPIHVRFGQDDRWGDKSRGLTFKAEPGSRVVAPLAGTVAYSGPFRGYGQILILRHEGGYHSLLAGMGRIDVTPGTKVDAGEPVGVTPSDGAVDGLYFELRLHGDPVDPHHKGGKT